jgi:hypothetical protein
MTSGFSKTRSRSLVVTAALSILLVAAPFLTEVSSAQGGSAPPWEPDAYQNADGATGYGNLVFYDANGDQITGGTNLSDPWGYMAGTTPFPQETAVGVSGVYFALPNPAEVTGEWTTAKEASSSSPTLPDTAPADLQDFDSTYPVLAPAGADLQSYINAVGSGFSTATGYANLIQVRLVPHDDVSRSNGPYYETDIAFNTGSSAISVDGVSVPADGWAQVFPLITATTTKLTSTLKSPEVSGTDIPLTATVSPKEAGYVQFYDGTTALGSPVAVSKGKAAYTDSRPPAIGKHSYTATFIPYSSTSGPGDESATYTANATIIGGSTSNALSITIAAVVVKSITPNTLSQGSSEVGVTIAGGGFVTGAKVTSSGTGVTFTSVAIVSSTEITADATVTSSAATGARSITVKDSAGKGTCTKCLTINT